MKMANPSRKGKVLITGIEGFTGKFLQNLLTQSSFEVEGTSFDKNYGASYYLDITKPKDIIEVINHSNPDYIVHLAALSFANLQEKLPYYLINTLGTQNLIESIIESGINLKKLLIPSSATVYGNQTSSILDETMCPNPANHYGCSKLSMELIAKNYFDNVPTIITRPFNYTGPGQLDSFVIPKIVNHFKKGLEKIELGNLNVHREFNDVRYVCKAYELLMISEVHSAIVNISSNITYSLSEILSILERLTGHQINVDINPDFVRKNEISKLSGSTNLLSTLIELPDVVQIEETLGSMLRE